MTRNIFLKGGRWEHIVFGNKCEVGGGRQQGYVEIGEKGQDDRVD